MKFRTRKRLSAVVLIVGLPLYVIAAVWLVDQVERPGLVIELGIYVVLGVAWALPLKWLFTGIGKPDPDA